MADEVYFNLRELLDRLPGGYPATETGVEIRILKKLFSPEDAGIVLGLAAAPEAVSAIAPRLQMSEEEALAKLRNLSERGLIGRMPAPGGPRFRAVQFAVGFYEAQVATLDRELAALVDEYLPYVTDHWWSNKTQQLRVLPVATAIEYAPAVSSYDDIRELVKDKQVIAVRPCICRKERALVGQPCDHPAEICLSFDAGARAAIESGVARRITREEFTALLSLGEEAGLIPSPNNAQNILFLCMCCTCSCAVLRNLKRTEKPAAHVQSSFQAKIDADQCTACGVCRERCQMEAIEDAGRVYAVDPDRCIGCGLCIARCPDRAISLIAKPGAAPVPSDPVEMNLRIAQERGLAQAPAGRSA